MNDDLDTRARAAAVALHDSVRHVSAPVALTPRRRPALTVAFAAGVAIVALAIALRNDGANDTDVVTDNDGDVPRFILETPPPGLLPTGVVDLPLGGAGAITQTYWVYGDPSAMDPFADADLGVVTSTGSDAELVPPDDSREVEVDGRSAWIATSRDPLDPRSITFETDDGAIVYLASRTLTDDELIDAAGAVVSAEQAPRTLGGLELIAQGSGEPIGTIPLPLPTNAGHIAGYQTEDDAANKVVVVASVAGGEDAYLVARWALGPTARAITIRGTEGWVGAPYGESSIVVWRESPTNVVAVSAFGLDEATTLAAAESLQIAGDEVWEELLAGTGEVRVPSSAQAGVAAGDIDGTSYAVYIDRDGSLCIDIETEGGSTGSCGGGDDSPLVVQASSLPNGSVVVYGYTTLGTDGEVQIIADDARAGSEAYTDEGTVFGGHFAADHVPAEILVLAADGTELGRAEVPAPGGGTSGGPASTIPASSTSLGG